MEKTGFLDSLQKAIATHSATLNKTNYLRKTMPNPFPGMNPYLEQPEYWSDFHNQLVAAIARNLVPPLAPKYRVVTDKWVYKIGNSTSITIGRPDVSVQNNRESKTTLAATITAQKLSVKPVKVAIPLREEVRQSYIEVKDTATKEVVAVVEVLSPANKTGEGHQKYLAKRQQILESMTHLVEIDLLRGGSAMPVFHNSKSKHYRILVSRGNTRPTPDLYSFNVGDRLPSFPFPLLPTDIEPILDLQQLVSELYEQLGYEYFIDYNKNPPSPWSFDDVKSWVSF
ncbi:DUF4058 family protein [Okeania sp.]|uniref:DUF4058 family protein n=1 Tax=Okeania sp. TaxID=3100323 RepID=UPI002B4AC316|nr:DUF4058 family protein [Okeania sp.]